MLLASFNGRYAFYPALASTKPITRDVSIKKRLYMSFRFITGLVLVIFMIGSWNSAEAQIFKKKKKVEQEAPKKEKKSFFDNFSKKDKKESTATKPVKEKKVLRKTHQAAKADVKASKKERKAAEAREEAARARAAVIKAQRKEERANRKVGRKETTANKSRTKAEEKKGKGLSRFFKKEDGKEKGE